MGDRLATIGMGQKWGAVPLLGGGAGFHVTMRHVPRRTFLPSGVLIHPAIWPQQTWADFVFWGEGAVPLAGAAGFASNTMLPRPTYHRTKWHLDPCSRLATIDMGRKMGALSPFWEG